MPETLREEVVLKRVRKYFRRIHGCNSLLPVYPPEEEGIFKIVGGACNADGRRYDIERSIVRGHFVDVIGYAVKLTSFYPEDAPQDPGNSQAGYIVKVELVELEENGSLDAVVRELERQGAG